MSDNTHLPAARDHLAEALRFLELVHMAAKSLEKDERDAIHAGIDAATCRIVDAKLGIYEGGRA